MRLFLHADLFRDYEDYGHHGGHRPQVLVRADETGGCPEAETRGACSDVEPRNYTYRPNSSVGGSRCQRNNLMVTQSYTFLIVFKRSSLYDAILSQVSNHGSTATRTDTAGRLLNQIHVKSKCTSVVKQGHV